MSSPSLTVELQYGAVSVSAELALFSLDTFHAGLREVNNRSRQREGRRPILIRVECPSCGAGPMRLTSVTEVRGERRACRRCHHRFSVSC